MEENKVKESMAENVAKVVGQAYEDIAHPILKSIGSMVSLPFRAIDVALTPIKKWIDKKNFNYEETRKLLAQKLAKVDESQIVEPEPYVAVPAIQQLSYSYDSEDLRTMYANLLASSMTDITRYTVHPSYVDIIKQLSPIDAKALNMIFKPEYLSVINIRAYYTNVDMYKDVFQNYSIELEELYRDNLEQSSSLLNLVRLGIITIDYDRTLQDKARYDKYNDSYWVQKALDRYKDDENVKVEINRGLICLTDFGISFCMTCCGKDFDIMVETCEDK